MFVEALEFYVRIREPYSIGWTHKRLACLASRTERDDHIKAAREAWLSIDRPDLLTNFEDME